MAGKLQNWFLPGSEPGMGTISDNYFPETKDWCELKTSRQEIAMPTGTETILYVDDEPMLCDIAGEMLENLGYSIVGKTDSIEAYNFFAADPQRFDAVITDMSMPQLTGDKLAQKILALRSNTPIILCTGYSENISSETASKMGIQEFLIKPYEMTQLAHALRRALEGKRLQRSTNY